MKLIFIIFILSLSNLGVLCTFKLVKLNSNPILKSTGCSDTNIIDPAKGVLETVAGVLEGNPFSAAASFVGLLGSIFGFDSGPSNCEIDAKLDKLILKLNDISQQLETIESMIQCVPIKTEYERVTLQLNTMMNLVYEYSRSSYSKDEFRQALRSACKDNSQGLNIILSSLLHFLEEEPLLRNFQSCGGYKSSYIDAWSNQFQQMTFMYVFLVKSCEEAFEYDSEFNKTDFVNVVKDKIDFYRNYVVSKYFFSEKLDTVVKAKANEGKTAKETHDYLKANYGYLNWEVIYYPVSVIGYPRHKWIRYHDDAYFGSRVYFRELDTGKNAIISWSHPAAIQTNSLISFQSNWDCLAACWIIDDFVKYNSKLSLTYAHIISDAASVNVDKYGGLAVQNTTRNCKVDYYYMQFYTYLSASVYSGIYQKNNPSFQNKAIAFPKLDAPLASLNNGWSMSNLKDTWGNADLTSSIANYTLAKDRRNVSSSAFYLKNSSYLMAPLGVYFNGDFTITVWINLKSNTSKLYRIIDFGDATFAENVVLAFQPSSKLVFSVYSGQRNSSMEVSCTFSLLNSWRHFAFTLRSGVGLIYVDGIKKSIATSLYSPRNVQRTKNYIGKSNGNDPSIDAVIDELKIYSGARPSYQIMDEYMLTKK